MATSSCSRAIMRSIASSTVTTGAAVGSPGLRLRLISRLRVSAPKLIPARVPARIIAKQKLFHVRIYIPLSVRQLEYDVNDGGQIHWLAVLLCRMEPNLPGCRFGGFIQTVTQALHNTHNFHFPRSRENNLQQHFAFDLFGACPHLYMPASA